MSDLCVISTGVQFICDLGFFTFGFNRDPPASEFSMRTREKISPSGRISKKRYINPYNSFIPVG